MSLRDLGFWMRSARADALLQSLRQIETDERAFDRLYQMLRDPWSTLPSKYRYQHLKYRRILSALPGSNLQRCLDVGCGLGMLSRWLATQIDQVVGVDWSITAIEQARALSTAISNLQFEHVDLRLLCPDRHGAFDLIVVVDTLYYLSPLDEAVIKSTRETLARLLTDDGYLLLANHFYLGIDGYSKITRRLHAGFGWATNLTRIVEEWRPFYLMTLYQKRSYGKAP